MTLAIRQSESDSLDSSLFGENPDAPGPISTPALVMLMLKSGNGISDLIFSPGRPPQVEQHGELTPVALPATSLRSTCRRCDRCTSRVRVTSRIRFPIAPDFG